MVERNIIKPSDKIEQIKIGGYTYVEQTAVSISGAIHATIGIPITFNRTALLLQPESEIMFNWDASTGDTLHNVNSLRLPANEIHEMAVPFELLNIAQATIYLHIKQVNSVPSKVIRYAEM